LGKGTARSEKKWNDAKKKRSEPAPERLLSKEGQKKIIVGPEVLEKHFDKKVSRREKAATMGGGFDCKKEHGERRKIIFGGPLDAKSQSRAKVLAN